jgi:hypothetical protein
MEMDGGRGAADGADPRDGRWCYAIGGDGFGVDRASSLSLLEHSFFLVREATNDVCKHMYFNKIGTEGIHLY